MPHNIESFVGGRDMPAWHNLGTTVSGLMTAKDALKRADLADWDVQVEPLTVELSDGTKHDLDGRYLTTRIKDGHRQPIATVGGRYTPVQNEEAFALADNIVDTAEARWDTAGALGSGERVFGSLLLPTSIVIDGEGIADKTDMYIMIATSHDGSLPVTAAVTPVRVVCQNTLNVALRGAKNKYKVRHTESSELRMIDARETLKVTFKYAETFEKEATALYEAAMTSNQFDSLISAVFGEEPEAQVNDKGDVINKAAISRFENRRDTLHDLLASDTQKGIRKTWWGGFNAIEEYYDYERSYRGDVENLYLPHLGFDVAMNRKKSELFAAAKELATV